MTEFQSKTFTVAMSATKLRCEHGMTRPSTGECCFCGASKAEVEAYYRRKQDTAP